MLERKSACVFPVAMALLVAVWPFLRFQLPWHAGLLGQCSKMALPVLALSFPTGWSSPQLHFPFCGEVLLLEAKHGGLICEWKTLPCEGAPALRCFFIPCGCRCPLSRRTSSRCLLRLCKLWVNFCGDAIFSFMCLSKGRHCSLQCIWIYLSTSKICCSFGGREHYIRSIIMFSPSFRHFFWSL